MYICYNKLWHLLLDRNMNREDLRKLTGISSASIAKLGKGQNITTDILIRICEVLRCDLNDIMELAYDERERSQRFTTNPLPRITKSESKAQP